MGGNNDGIPGRRTLGRRGRRRFFSAALALTLAFVLLAAPRPRALAREKTAAAMIEDSLAARKTLKSASKPELLAAICRSVRKQRSAAATLTSAAVAARRDLAGDIVGAVLRCAGKIDCEFVGMVVTAAVAAEGNPVTIGDAAIAQAPDCGETIQRATLPPKKDETGEPPASHAADQEPLIGTSAGADEGFDPLEPLMAVCDNGTQRALRTSLVEEFLHSHPGAYSGTCPPAAARQVTVRRATIATPTPAPTPTANPKTP